MQIFSKGSKRKMKIPTAHNQAELLRNSEKCICLFTINTCMHTQLIDMITNQIMIKRLNDLYNEVL